MTMRHTLTLKAVSPQSPSSKAPPRAIELRFRRRTLLIASLALITNSKPIKALELGILQETPDLAREDAEDGFKLNARNLLQVKELLDSESWIEAQRDMRRSASNMKQYLYAIIQSKPGNERPELRQLYSNLFNSVTRLDYAAMEKNASLAQQHFADIVVAIDDILSKF